MVGLSTRKYIFGIFLCISFPFEVSTFASWLVSLSLFALTASSWVSLHFLKGVEFCVALPGGPSGILGVVNLHKGWFLESCWTTRIRSTAASFTLLSLQWQVCSLSIIVTKGTDILLGYYLKFSTLREKYSVLSSNFVISKLKTFKRYPLYHAHVSIERKHGPTLSSSEAPVSLASEL